MSLTLGIACALLILLYIRDELSYDRFHDKADRIFRVVAEERQGDGVARTIRTIRTAEVMTPTVRFMREDFPEVEDMVRSQPARECLDGQVRRQGILRTRLLPGRQFSVFNVFDVPLLAGDPRTALSGNDRVVLSESVARKYFGDENPIGKILDAEGTFQSGSDRRHGGPAVQHAPRIRHPRVIQDTRRRLRNQTLDDWGWRRSYSYVLLREGSDPAELEARLPAFVEKYVGDIYDGEASSLTYRLQPVTDIHLHSRLERELTPNSDIRYIYLFAAIGVFIILIASINFMNLATARSAGRVREIGLRRVFGAGRGQVMRQFLSESLIMSGLGVCIALLAVVIGLPWFNLVSGKTISLNAETTWFILGAVALTGRGRADIGKLSRASFRLRR